MYDLILVNLIIGMNLSTILIELMELKSISSEDEIIDEDYEEEENDNIINLI